MLHNPVFLFANSGLVIPGPWYELTFTGDANGTCTAMQNIGKDGNTITLSAIPNEGYQISGYECSTGTIDGNTYTFTNSDATISAYFKEESFNPLGLPDKTIRCKFKSGYTPSMGDSQTLVDAEENIWDITKNSDSWYGFFDSNGNLTDILGANAAGVTSFERFCHMTDSLTSTVLFDTRDATNIWNMYNKATALPSIPDYQFDNATNCESFMFECFSVRTPPKLYTPKATNMSYMFFECTAMSAMPEDLITSAATNVGYMFCNDYNVTGGIYDFYEQLSTQTNPPSNHEGTFYNCGSDTQQGSVELAQIPWEWK